MLYEVITDHQTLQDNTVTIRMRDNMEQKRIGISELDSILAEYTSYP